MLIIFLLLMQILTGSLELKAMLQAPMVSPNYIKTSANYCTTDGDLLQDFCVPITFNRTGMSDFLKKRFNNVRYAVDYLQYSFSHFLQFIEYGIISNQSRPYFEASIRLFLNKLKMTRYITDSAFDSMLIQLPDLLAEQCVVQPLSLKSVSHNLKDFLYDTFLSKFSLFKNSTDIFFDELSSDIIVLMQDHVLVNEAVSREQLRQIIIRFLELGLSKVLWSPLDQAGVWKSVKSIASHLEMLLVRGMINQDELDDLYKSLLESFCRFLEITGTDLSDAVLENIKEEAYSSEILFLSLDEQEEHLQTKRERLLEVLMMVKAKKIAQDNGLILDPLPKGK